MADNPSIKNKLLVALVVVAGLAGMAIAIWWFVLRGDSNQGILSTNGRIEAVEVHVATKLAGRIDEVLVREGDRVAAGDVIARLDTATLDARLRQALADVERTKAASAQAESVLEQRHSECDFAQKELDRAERLFKQGHVTEEALDQRRTNAKSAHAACGAAEAGISQTKASTTAAEAVVAQIRTDIEDSTLRAPVGGQVLYRLAEPGEVLGAGGRVVTVIDFADFYMTVYLPAEAAGRVGTGDQARIVLDAFPDRALPAVISFVSPKAQFTPKEVETAEERQKLTFRVKLSILPEAYEPWFKPGMTGLGYVRLERDQPWPDDLQ